MHMIVCMIQTRMGSTRLPGKVMKEVEGKALLQHMIERMIRSKFVDKFVVATSVKKENDVIEKLCKQLGILCCRGSEDDVLDRYYQCAKSFDPVPEYIMRVTADCPLQDPEVIDFVVKKFLEKKVDYVTNSFEPLYEDGFDVEIFKFSALEEAWKKAVKRSEREHVTPYIRNSTSFKKYYEKYCSTYTYKLSVDTQNDFELIKQIFSRLYAPGKIFGINEVVSLLKSDPSLLKVNKESIINAGYQKSLLEDLKK